MKIVHQSASKTKSLKEHMDRKTLLDAIVQTQVQACRKPSVVPRIEISATACSMVSHVLLVPVDGRHTTQRPGCRNEPGATSTAEGSHHRLHS